MNPRVLPLLFALVPSVASSTEIWIEGETPDSTTCKPHGWYDSVKKEALSEGKWLSHFTDEGEGTASYTIDAPEAGDYLFWLRGNPLRSAVSWRIDDGPEQLIDWEAGQRGRMNIASDNKPDLRFITWCRAGTVKLTPGKHHLGFRFHSKNNHHGAIDCFCLSNSGWIPSGLTKPGTGPAAGPDTWFPVVADLDPLSPDSVTDVSHLIPAPAGKLGFLKADGESLRFDKADQPVKFWAIGSNLAGTRTDQEMEQRARWYRKHGINCVRQHTVIGDTGLLNADGRFDPEKLDRYDRWFATLKKHGIYTTWSVIYPHHGAMLRKQDGIDPEKFATLDESDKHRDGNNKPIVVNDYINLDRELQDHTLRFFKALLEHRNPHTGLRYNEEPALAVLEFQNESNVFFHTLNNLAQGKPAFFADKMRRAFFEFVREKYGTRDKAAAAWNGKWQKQDAWEGGELALAAPYHWGPDGPLYEFAGQLRRVGDSIEFWAKLQRDYYARRKTELRGLGFRGVLVTTAWKGVGASSLANLWCDTAADMIDRHNYFGGGDGGHSITEGKVSNDSHLGQPGRGLLNLGLFQVEDRPFGVSEWSMMPPSPWKAEAAPLYAFYGLGLQGWDASYHFACSAGRLGDGWPGLGKYVSHTPHYVGQFPALAFAIHRGHVSEAEPVSARQAGPAETFAGRDVFGQSIAEGGHDTKELGNKVSTPPEHLAIGKVTMGFAGGERIERDVAKFWNKQSSTLESTTGQLRWNYGDRYVEVRTPRTQGIIGFAGGRKIELPGVSVALETSFASLLFTPLDDLRLDQSRKILVTAMARDKQSGAVFNDDWSELRTVGASPLLMEPVQARIKLAGPKPTRVRACDPYGVPKDSSPAITTDGSFAIDGTHQAYYYFIER